MKMIIDYSDLILQITTQVHAVVQVSGRKVLQAGDLCWLLHYRPGSRRFRVGMFLAFAFIRYPRRFSGVLVAFLPLMVLLFLLS